MLATCPSCGEPLPEAAVRFCLACGTPLPARDQQLPAGDQQLPARDQQLPARDEDTAPARTADLGSPYRPGPDKPPPSRSNLILVLVALVVIAGGGTGGYVMLHHTGRTPARTSQQQKTASPPSSQGSAAPLASQGSAAPVASSAEQGQLAQFLTAVRGSVAARTLVKNAVSQVGSCAMTPAAGISRLEQAITDRKDVLATMNGLSVSAIPAGLAMRTDLDNVLHFSISADRDFIGWMQDPQSTQDCPTTTTQDANYTSGVQVSGQAMQAKSQFLAMWNPLAEQFNLPTYTTLGI